MMTRLSPLLVLLALLPSLAGCVTEVVEKQPVARATLVVTMSDNVATLQWQTQRGMLYSLMHSPSRGSSAVWKPLPGAERVVGDGGMMRLSDPIPPGQERFYRLHVIGTSKPK